ncbi:NAD(P)H-hydrate dehydratase [Alkalicaulis satelles]|uniref:Bifunctional NAD(P)H-hydrate repair enzyme n=1 Tax=Alkalicaulis satelles TaxID=2609175 RepID=A0A5M6ZI09_9PROT|nr:NAD(P)H-hydrate dehydratase [Alkalicaulis satelles]KAA5804466.1 NAD(P)H-hydrate dehydratase [Alkalicaulis satelles]
MRVPHALLTPDAMARADAYAVSKGVSGETLMAAAGAAMVRAIEARWAPRPAAVLCGPGNNGGDGWVAARLMKKSGWPVQVFSAVPVTALKGDAASAARGWTGRVEALEACDPARFALVVDALFGAGLSRPLEGEAARLAEACREGPVVVSADVPSGLDGAAGRAEGAAFKADLTVTFHRLKPGHVLQPGRVLCGEIVCADIGIPDGWEAEAAPCAQLNHPDLWPVPGLELEAETHKHRRGRLTILSGPAGSGGAAQLAARAGLLGGAGFVTLALPSDAAPASDPLLVSRPLGQGDLAAHLSDTRADAAVIGPGAGLHDALKVRVAAALERRIPLVLDADALTVFADAPEALFAQLHPRCVLTPHAGEFARLFPGLAEGALNKIEAAREAARLAHAIIVYKGPDTVIAAPNGAVRVNVHASARLATAGTGDVLAGLTGAFLAQGAAPFEAACAAVWLHGDAGRRLGPGATAGDVLACLPQALAAERDRRARQRALQRLTAQR